MRTSDFDYDLPDDRIAQRPANPRDSSRLLVFDRKTGRTSDSIFRDLPQFLHAGDALVINETKVIPARLQASKIPGGGQVELLLLKEIEPTLWETMVGGKGLTPERQVKMRGDLTATIEKDLGGPKRLVRFSSPVAPLLDHIGELPLPPYIHTPLQDRREYQTTFANTPGSAAAPTAGLHFTKRMLSELQDLGIHLVRVTLHVGLDTFAPVHESDPQEHRIHSEWCQLDQEAANNLNRVRAEGKRIFAVGTTSVRTLESAARDGIGRNIAPYEGPTELFILPGYEFKVVDALITNFHLPRSTLLMLVSAFAGRENVLDLYAHAMDSGYRFYSFGDAMLIT